MTFPETPEGDVAVSLAVSRSPASPGYPFDEAEALSRIEKDDVGAERDPTAMGRRLGAHWNGGRLEQLTLPAVVLHGDSDQLLRASAARDLAGAIAGARLVIVPGVGHDLPRGARATYADEVRAVASADSPHRK